MISTIDFPNLLKSIAIGFLAFVLFFRFFSGDKTKPKTKDEQKPDPSPVKNSPPPRRPAPLVSPSPNNTLSKKEKRRLAQRRAKEWGENDKKELEERAAAKKKNTTTEQTAAARPNHHQANENVNNANTPTIGSPTPSKKERLLAAQQRAREWGAKDFQELQAKKNRG